MTQVTIEAVAKNLAERGLSEVEDGIRGIAGAATDAETELARFNAALEQPASSKDFLERVQSDVETATADFKAGIIGVEDYTTALEVARKEAIAHRQQVGGFAGRELTLFSTIIGQTTVKTAEAARGSRLLAQGVQGIAMQAIGASGPVGRFAQGIALLLGGTGVALGAAGALAVLGLAYRAITKEAREADKAQRDAIQSLLELREKSRDPGARVDEDVATARERLERINRQLTQAEETLAAARAGVFGRGSLAAAEGAEQRIRDLREDQLEALRAINAPALSRQAEERREEQERFAGTLGDSIEALRAAQLAVINFSLTEDEAAEAARRLELAIEGYAAAEIEAIVGVERQTLALEKQRAVLERNRDLLKELDEFLRTLAPVPTNQPFPLRGPRPGTKDLPLAPVPGAEGGGTGTLTAAEDFGLRMADALGTGTDAAIELADTLARIGDDTIRDLGNAFEDLFAAVFTGSELSGKAFAAAFQGAIAAVARSFGQMFLAEGIAALARGIGLGFLFPGAGPAGVAAAAKFFAAATAMFALAGAVGGGSGGGGSAGGGSGPGGFRDNNRSLRDERQPVTVIVEGWHPDDVRVVDTIARIIEAADGRRVIIRREG